MKILFQIIGLLFLFTANAQSAEQAGTARFILGKVVARTVDGGERRLMRNSIIYSGETISTQGRARAQLQFDDGSFVSMQPESEFRVDDYRQASGSAGGRMIVSLAKGGLRMITGSIGKTDPRSVQVKTSVVTIGIRGTGFTLQNCSGDCSSRDSAGTVPDGLYAYVTDGRIVLSNEAGELEAAKGFGVYVSDMNSPAVLTQVQPLTLPPVTDANGDDANGQGDADDTSRISTGTGLDAPGPDTQLTTQGSDPAPLYKAGEQVTPDGVTTTVPVGAIDLNLTF